MVSFGSMGIFPSIVMLLMAHCTPADSCPLESQQSWKVGQLTKAVGSFRGALSCSESGLTWEGEG